MQSARVNSSKQASFNLDANPRILAWGLIVTSSKGFLLSPLPFLGADFALSYDVMCNVK